MRILLLSDFPPYVIGGAERQAQRLAVGWARLGHEVRCAGRRLPGGTLHADGVSFPAHHIVASGPLRVIKAFCYFLSILTIVLSQRRRPEVVYTRFIGEAALCVALLKKLRILRCVLVATPAGAGGIGDLAFIRKLPLNDWLLRLLDQHCDTINCISSAIEGEFIGAGFRREAISAIPNGVEIRRLRRSPPECGPLVVLAVSRLSDEKGLDVLLRAVASLPRGLVRLRIVGDGPCRRDLERQVDSADLSNHVTFVGELESAAVAPELDRADLFVLPSLSEGMSNAGLEAIERGLPIIITACGGLDSFITPEMGWVVAPGDSPALADALSAACAVGRQRLSKMGTSARKLAEDKFNMDRISARYISLFEQLALTQRNP